MYICMYVRTYVHTYVCTYYLPMVEVKQREPNVITLQKPQYFVFKLHCVLQTCVLQETTILLHKTTDCTTNNYTKLQINYMHMQHT